MSTLDLSPKNPMLLLVLAGAAVWILSRRQAQAQASAVRPSAVGARTVNSSLAPILSAIGGMFRSEPQPSLINEAARAAVRVGDPYYGGEYAINGSVGGWIDQAQIQAQIDSDAWNVYAGTSDDTTGDPYNW